jgi:S-adenosylmethionine hydrolase
MPLRLGESIEIRLGTTKLQAQYSRSYSDAEKGSLAVLVGSQGFLEIAVREGSARDTLDVKPLDKLVLRF